MVESVTNSQSQGYPCDFVRDRYECCPLCAENAVKDVLKSINNLLIGKKYLEEN